MKVDWSGIACCGLPPAGLRVSEFLAPRWRHVLWDKGKIFIERCSEEGRFRIASRPKPVKLPCRVLGSGYNPDRGSAADRGPGCQRISVSIIIEYTALPRSRTMSRHRLPQRCEIRAKPMLGGCIMNTPWRGTPHEATAMRNHRTLIASPLKLSGPWLLIDLGSWAAIRIDLDHGRLERCNLDLWLSVSAP